MSTDLQETETSNGGAEVVGSLATEEASHGPKPYYFDKTPLTEEIPWRDGVVMRVTYSKPQDEDHDKYETQVERKVEVKGGESTNKTNARIANVEYFDSIVQQAELFKTGEKLPFETWDRDKCLELPTEWKVAVIIRIGQCEFELIGGDSDSLMFSKENWKVRQYWGDTEYPDQEIIYEMTPLSQAQRFDYGEGSNQKEKTVKKTTTITTKQSLQRKARKLFAANLVSIVNGLISAGEYSVALKNEYIPQIDSSFKLLVISTMMGYYNRVQD